MVDVRRPFNIRPEALTPIRYASPWTGRQLTAKTLIGATFVWFALVCFWRDVRSNTGPQPSPHTLNLAVEDSEFDESFAEYFQET